MGDSLNFYKLLEIALQQGADANSLYPDIKIKFKEEKDFIDLVKKYNQKLNF